jgi:hypothetical protein
MTNAGAEMTVRIFLKEWVTVFGPPRRLITDRGSNFTSVYFDELSKFLGTKPTQTVAYRPQSNGQNERTHRDFHQFIGIYIDQADRRHWDLLLKLASWVHNSSYHDVLKASPYEIVFGIKPHISKMWIPSKIDEIDEHQLQEYFGLKKEKLERLREAAKNAISRSQERFLLKQGAKKPAPKFVIGQLVLVKQHRASKWAPRYDGPFIITKIISENTVELKRKDSEQKDTVHIDYIRPYYSRDGSPAIGRDAQFPDETDERSDNINYDTRILFDEPAEDFIVETETNIQTKNMPTTTSPRQQSFSPRVTRSMSRLMQTSANPDPVVNQQNQTQPARVQPKAKSALSRVRNTLKKALPKQVSFRASSSRQHSSVPDAVAIDTTSARSHGTRAATSDSNSRQQNPEPSYQTPRAQVQSVPQTPSTQTQPNSNNPYDAHSALDDSQLPSTHSSVRNSDSNFSHTTIHEVTPIPIQQIPNKFTTRRKRS